MAPVTDYQLIFSYMMCFVVVVQFSTPEIIFMLCPSIFLRNFGISLTRTNLFIVIYFADDWGSNSS